LDAGNWQLDKITCSAGSLSVSWIKASESAWISHIVAQRPTIAVTSDGLAASVTVQALASPSASDETLPMQSEARLRLYDLASRYASSVSIGQVAAPAAPPTLPGQAPGPVVTPLWVELPFTFISSLPPSQVAGFLTSPGLRMTQFDASLKAGAFKYTFIGVQYVKP
jgi:hypothetical protein